MKGLGHLRDRLTGPLFCPSAFHVCKLVLSGRQRGEMCSKKRILVLHSRSLSKTSHQLVKPRKYSSPASRMDLQKLTSGIGNYKNTWMQESAFFAWREKPLMTQFRKKKHADTCANVSGSYLRKETGPSSEVAVDHPVCRIPQASEKIEARNPLH